MIVSFAFSFTSNVGKAICPKAFSQMSEFPPHSKVFLQGTEAANISTTGAATQTTWALFKRWWESQEGNLMLAHLLIYVLLSFPISQAVSCVSDFFSSFKRKLMKKKFSLLRRFPLSSFAMRMWSRP